MSDWNFQVKADADKAIKDTRTLEDGMVRVENQAVRAGSSMSRAFAGTGAAARDAQGRFLASSQTGKVLGDAMDQTARHATRAASEIGHVGVGMQDVLHIAEAYIGLHVVESLVDGYTEVSNKLRIVAVDQQNLKGLMEATFKVAQDTRTGWGDVTSVFQRLSQVTAGLGLSQKDVIDLTKEMSMASKISGASSREAAMSMGEITHAFETGALMGREYKVLMRDTPAMMHELQVASGKTASQFAHMGKEGHITAQLLIDWFGKASGAIEEKFGRTVPTIADSFTMLRNAAEKFFGEAGTQSGVLRDISEAMGYVIRNFDIFGGVILAVGEVLVGLFVIEKIIALVKLLSVAVAANPLGALLLAATIGISLLRQFSGSLSYAGNSALKVSDIFRVLWHDIKELAGVVKDFVADAWHMLTDAFSSGIDTGGIELSIKNVMHFIATFIDSTIAVFRIMKSDGLEIFGALFVEIAAAAVRAFNTAIHAVADFVSAGRKAVYNFLNDTTFKEHQASSAAYSATATAMAPIGAALAKQYPAPVQPAFVPSYVMPGPDVTDAQVNAQEEAHAKYEADMVVFHKAQAEWLAKQSDEYKRIHDSTLANNLARERASRGLVDDEQHLKNLTIDIGEIQSDSLNKAKAAADQKLKDARAEMIKQGSSGPANKYLESVEGRAQPTGASAPGYVSDVRGSKEAVEATKAQEAAMRKFLETLREVEAQSNPMVDAQMKLSKAFWVETQAVLMGKRTFEQARDVIADTIQKTEAAREPLEKWTRDIEDNIAALKMSDNERERSNMIRKAEMDLTKDGLGIHEAEHKIIADKIALQLGANAANTIAKQRQDELQSDMVRLNSANNDYYNGTARTQQLFAQGAIHVREYYREIDRLRLAYLDASTASKTMAGGAEKGLLEIKLEVLDVGSLVEKSLVGAFHNFEDAMVKAAQTGKLSFSSMASAMIADITRIAIRILEMRLLMAFLPGPAASIAAGATPSAVASGGGHAQGGTYRAGGSGGPDSQLVMVRMTPGETMEFKPKGNQGGGGGNFEAHFHYDATALMRGLRSPAGRKVMVSVIREEREAIKAVLG